MYVCLCNGFTDRQVRNVVGEGPCSTASVYRSLGVRPQCGKCVPMVRDILRGAESCVRASSLDGLVPA